MENMLERQEKETYVSFLKRIVNLTREKTISYIEMGDALLGEKNVYSSDNLRKAFYILDKIADNLDVDCVVTDNDLVDLLEEKTRKFEREKIKYRDARNAWQKQNYTSARIDETLELLDEKLINQGKINFKVNEKPTVIGDTDLICMLTDLHLGQTFSSMWGEYNLDIAKERLEKYLNEILEIQKTHKAQNCHISLQGDIISGSIHKTIQISNRENVIEQIKAAIELISSFCYELTNHFNQVFLYNVSGNHSRLIDKKEEAVHNERFDDFIGWDIERTLSHIDNFHMMKHRNLDIGIVDINVKGKSYIACHGDYDGFNQSGVMKLCSMLKFFPEAILYGHLHTPSTDEINEIKMVRSGSLAGSGDDYTIEKRLCGKPSQTVLVCDEKGIKCFYNVDLS